MSKIYTDNGHLSEEGKFLTMDVRTAVYKLLHWDEQVKTMNENELRTLGSALQKIVGDAIAERIQMKAVIDQKVTDLVESFKEKM